MKAEKRIEEQLFALQDLKYRDFVRPLLPTVDPERIIGVRTPALRKLAASCAETEEEERFLCILPHRYYEENNLHAFFLGKIKDYGTAVEAIDTFLPYVDNWATCDTMCPKIFGRHQKELLDRIRIWIRADHPYTVRFAIGLLMNFYLDEAFDPAYPEAVAGVRSDEYYVKMMAAWYFATALAKQYEAALPYLTAHRLDSWTHNKTIQKAVESYRITPAQKAYLKTLRIPRGVKIPSPSDL